MPLYITCYGLLDKRLSRRSYALVFKMAKPPKRASPDEDKKILKQVVSRFLGIPQDAYDDEPLVKALIYARILGFYEDFIGLTEGDIEGLQAPPDRNGGPFQPISPVHKRKLIMTLAMFHDGSRVRGGPLSMRKATKNHFDMYRISDYDSTKPIVPWNVALPDEHNKELIGWNKSIKRTSQDYPLFKQETSWLEVKDGFENTLASQSLEHLVDPNYVVVNKELDDSQRNWLYKVFEKTMKASMAKKIVKNHKETKDTRAIWSEIVDHYDHSMTIEFKADAVSTYLTSARLHQMDWRSTQEEYIHHYSNQARIYNETVSDDDKFGDKHLVRLLNNSVSGVPNLANVRNTYEAAQQATGVNKPLTFAEYTQLLVKQAQIYDSAKKLSRNPRVTRQVNMTDLTFDEDPPEEHSVHGTYDVQVHDIDTDVEYLMAMQTEQRRPPATFNGGQPGRVSLNKQTWESLSKSDQDGWDLVSEKGKKSILDYGASRKPPPKKWTPQPDRRNANTHEVIFEEDEEEQPQVEVQAHKVQPKKTQPAQGRRAMAAETRHQVQQPGDADLLKLALTLPNVNSGPNSQGVDINHVLSQPSNPKRSVSKHEYLQ